MNIIIVGAGNLGSSLAQKISDLGHQVTIIEKNFEAASSLPRGRVNSGLLKVIHSDGSTASAMIAADIANEYLVLVDSAMTNIRADRATQTIEILERRFNRHIDFIKDI